MACDTSQQVLPYNLQHIGVAKLGSNGTLGPIFSRLTYISILVGLKMGRSHFTTTIISTSVCIFFSKSVCILSHYGMLVLKSPQSSYDMCFSVSLWNVDNSVDMSPIMKCLLISHYCMLSKNPIKICYSMYHYEMFDKPRSYLCVFLGTQKIPLMYVCLRTIM